MTTIVQESNIGGSGTFPCFVIYTARSEFEFGIRLDRLPKKNVPSTDSDEKQSVVRQVAMPLCKPCLASLR